MFSIKDISRFIKRYLTINIFYISVKIFLHFPSLEYLPNFLSYNLKYIFQVNYRLKEERLEDATSHIFSSSLRSPPAARSCKIFLELTHVLFLDRASIYTRMQRNHKEQDNRRAT